MNNNTFVGENTEKSCDEGNEEYENLILRQKYYHDSLQTPWNVEHLKGFEWEGGKLFRFIKVSQYLLWRFHLYFWLGSQLQMVWISRNNQICSSSRWSYWLDKQVAKDWQDSLCSRMIFIWPPHLLICHQRAVHKSKIS